MRETLFYRKDMNSTFGLVLFFAGLIAGIVFVQFQNDAVFAGIFSEYFLNQYASLKLDYRKLLGYVGGCRCGQYVLLVCCGALSAAPWLFDILLFLLGMIWGTLLSVSTIRLGLKGVLICAVGLIPQLFFYVVAFGWILMWIWRRGSSRKKYLLLSGIGFFFLLFGIVTEVYINPMILQQMLRKM